MRDGYPGVRLWPRERLGRAASTCGSCPPTRGDRRGVHRRAARVGRDAVEPARSTCATSTRWPRPRTPPARCSAVDNTVATPLGQRPLDHGADLSRDVRHQVALGALRRAARRGQRPRPELLAALRALALADRRAARPVRGLARAPLARHARRCGSSARAPARWPWPRRSPAAPTCRCAAPPRHPVAARQMAPTLSSIHTGSAERAQACWARAAGRRGDKLRRRPRDGRAARPLGHRRGAGGLHPLLGRDARTRRTSWPTCCRHSTRAPREGPAAPAGLSSWSRRMAGGQSAVRLAAPEEGVSGALGGGDRGSDDPCAWRESRRAIAGSPLCESTSMSSAALGGVRSVGR